MEMATDFKNSLAAFGQRCLQDKQFQVLLNLPEIKDGTKDERSLMDKIEEIKGFIRSVDEIVPYLQLSLSITAQSTQLTSKVSPSRLLQASNSFRSSEKLVGPQFLVKLYTLFGGSARSKNVADWT